MELDDDNAWSSGMERNGGGREIVTWRHRSGVRYFDVVEKNGESIISCLWHSKNSLGELSLSSWLRFGELNVLISIEVPVLEVPY